MNQPAVADDDHLPDCYQDWSMGFSRVVHLRYADDCSHCFRWDPTGRDELVDSGGSRSRLPHCHLDVVAAVHDH
jgi:hypothetical protein